MSREDYKEFAVEYPFDGGWWTFSIKAKSHEEAEARLRAMGWARVSGMIGAKIPGWVPAWLISFYCRYLNWRDGKS